MFTHGTFQVWRTPKVESLGEIRQGQRQSAAKVIQRCALQSRVPAGWTAIQLLAFKRSSLIRLRLSCPKKCAMHAMAQQRTFPLGKISILGCHTLGIAWRAGTLGKADPRAPCLPLLRCVYVRHQGCRCVSLLKPRKFPTQYFVGRTSTHHHAPWTWGRLLCPVRRYRAAMFQTCCLAGTNIVSCT